MTEDVVIGLRSRKYKYEVVAETALENSHIIFMARVAYQLCSLAEYKLVEKIVLQYILQQITYKTAIELLEAITKDKE